MSPEFRKTIRRAGKRNRAKILALETSADETSAAVTEGSKILSHVIYSQIPTHRKTGGIVPEIAARAHIPKIIPAIKIALQKAKIELKNLDAIAVTAGPGLITSLMIGVDTAKTLAFALDKPIIPVNHLEGHLLSALTQDSRIQLLDSRFLPALGLVVSGGHTLLALIHDIGRYKILGQTLDDAAGECFDKVAKILGLPYPGGPVLSEMAGRGNPRAFDFPRPMIKEKKFNFSFAGLKTAVLYFIRDLPKNRLMDLRADICASVEQAIVDVLVAKTLNAARTFSAKLVLLGGGVSANQKLRKTLAQKISRDTQAKILLPTAPLTTDNAGMIAQAAFFHYRHGHTTSFDKVKANPNLELRSWR